MNDFQNLIQKYMAAKGQGVPDALNPNNPQPQSPIVDAAMQGVGDPNNVPGVPPVALNKNLTPLSQQFPDLNRILMAGVPGNPPVPSTPVVQPAPQATKASPGIAKAVAKKPEPKQDAASNEEDTSDDSSSEESEADDETDSDEPKKKYTIEELQAKQQAARQSASVMAGQMQGAAAASAVSGKPMSTEGYKAQMANDLGEASDYEKLIDQERNDKLTDMKLEAGKIDQEKALMQLGNAKEEHDVDSDVSKAARGVLANLATRLGMPPEKFDNLPYSAIEKLMPGIDKIVQAQIRADATRDAAADRNSNAQDKADLMATNKENMAHQRTIGVLESARGNPAVAQALKDDYAVSKFNGLVDLYGDPNKLSPQQVQLAASEVAKIATGGVPTHAELQGLNPSTVSTGLASIAQKVLNSPTPANVGAFIEQMRDYTNSLRRDARKVIRDKFGRVIESSHKSIGDDNYNMLKEQYLKPYEMAEEPKKQKMLKVSNGKQSFQIPESDLDHAKADGYKVME